jgi:hypothetical protein
MAGPDGEQVEAPTFLRGAPLRITEGGLLRDLKNEGEKMHGSMHVSGTLALDSCEKPGGPEGGPSF